MNIVIRFSLYNTVLFFYIFLSCLNQYFQIIGIPIFIYAQFLLIGLKLLSKPAGKNEPFFKNQILFFAAWFIYAFVLTVMKDNESAWRHLLFLFLNCTGYYVILSDCRADASRIAVCAKGFMAGIFVNFIVAFWEILTGGHVVPLTEIYIRRFFHVPLGFYVNSNDLAVVLVGFIVVVMIYYSVSKRKLLNKLITLFFVVVAYYIIIKTNSTIGTFSVPLILLIAAGYYLYRRSRSVIWAILMFGIAIFALGFIITGGDDLLALYVDNDSNMGESYYSRIDIWNATFEGFKDSYGFGIGPGQNSVSGPGLAHNLPLELMTEYGILIIVPMLIIYVMSIVRVMRGKFNFASCLVFAYLLMFIPLSICTSSMTKLFPIWNSLGLMLAFACENENIPNAEAAVSASV